MVGGCSRIVPSGKFSFHGVDSTAYHVVKSLAVLDMTKKTSLDQASCIAQLAIPAHGSGRLGMRSQHHARVYSLNSQFHWKFRIG